MQQLELNEAKGVTELLNQNKIGPVAPVNGQAALSCAFTIALNHFRNAHFRIDTVKPPTKEKGFSKRSGMQQGLREKICRAARSNKFSKFKDSPGTPRPSLSNMQHS